MTMTICGVDILHEIVFDRCLFHDIDFVFDLISIDLSFVSTSSQPKYYNDIIHTRGLM